MILLRFFNAGIGVAGREDSTGAIRVYAVLPSEAGAFLPGVGYSADIVAGLLIVVFFVRACGNE